LTFSLATSLSGALDLDQLSPAVRIFHGEVADVLTVDHELEAGLTLPRFHSFADATRIGDHETRLGSTSQNHRDVRRMSTTGLPVLACTSFHRLCQQAPDSTVLISRLQSDRPPPPFLPDLGRFAGTAEHFGALKMGDETNKNRPFCQQCASLLRYLNDAKRVRLPPLHHAVIDTE
jgi:hypothetical protein